MAVKDAVEAMNIRRTVAGRFLHPAVMQSAHTRQCLNAAPSLGCRSGCAWAEQRNPFSGIQAQPLKVAPLLAFKGLRAYPLF